MFKDNKGGDVWIIKLINNKFIIRTEVFKINKKEERK